MCVHYIFFEGTFFFRIGIKLCKESILMTLRIDFCLPEGVFNVYYNPIKYKLGLNPD